MYESIGIERGINLKRELLVRFELVNRLLVSILLLLLCCYLWVTFNKESFSSLVWSQNIKQSYRFATFQFEVVFILNYYIFLSQINVSWGSCKYTGFTMFLFYFIFVSWDCNEVTFVSKFWLAFSRYEIYSALKIFMTLYSFQWWLDLNCLQKE